MTLLETGMRRDGSKMHIKKFSKVLSYLYITNGMHGLKYVTKTPTINYEYVY